MEFLFKYYNNKNKIKKAISGSYNSKDQSFHTHLNQYNVLFLNMQRFLSREEDPNIWIFLRQNDGMMDISFAEFPIYIIQNQ